MNTHFKIKTEGLETDRMSGSDYSLQTTTSGSLHTPLEAVGQELAGIKSRLGWIDTAIVDRRINREAKRIIGDAYMQMLVAKREELITRITLGLDETKKKALIESLRISGEIDRDIAKLSTEFTTAMFEGAVSTSFTAAKEEHKKLQEIETAYNAGELAESRYKQLREAATEATDHITAIVKNNVAQIIRTHIEKVQLALELFKQRVLRDGI